MTDLLSDAEVASLVAAWGRLPVRTTDPYEARTRSELAALERARPFSDRFEERAFHVDRMILARPPVPAPRCTAERAMRARWRAMVGFVPDCTVWRVLRARALAESRRLRGVPSAR